MDLLLLNNFMLEFLFPKFHIDFIFMPNYLDIFYFNRNLLLAQYLKKQKKLTEPPP